MDKVWFITGSGKGIGRAIALAALKAGDYVVATTRKTNGFEQLPEYQDKLLNLKLDVSDTDAQVYEQVVEIAVQKFGRIDVLVNNAGYGAITNFEETSEDSVRKLFEVNLFGTMRVTRAVLPYMRNQRDGRIFNIASGGGYAPGPVPYHTTKFAVTGFSTCLAFELEPFGIKVTNVAPGLFRTGFYDKGTWETEPDIHIEDYDEFRWQTAFVENAQKNTQPGDPDKLAALIVEVAACDSPPLHLPIGADAPAVLDTLCDKLKSDTDAWREKSVNTVF